MSGQSGYLLRTIGEGWAGKFFLCFLFLPAVDARRRRVNADRIANVVLQPSRTRERERLSTWLFVCNKWKRCRWLDFCAKGFSRSFSGCPGYPENPTQRTKREKKRTKICFDYPLLFFFFFFVDTIPFVDVLYNIDPTSLLKHKRKSNLESKGEVRQRLWPFYTAAIFFYVHNTKNSCVGRPFERRRNATVGWS